MGFSAWHADFAHWSVAGCAVSGDVWLVAAGGFDVSGALALLAQPATARGLLHRGKTSFGMLKRMCRSCRVRPVLPPRSAFAGFRFPREVLVLAVRWYLRYGLSYRDVEELLAERGVQVDHAMACWCSADSTVRPRESRTLTSARSRTTCGARHSCLPTRSANTPTAGPCTGPLTR